MFAISVEKEYNFHKVEAAVRGPNRGAKGKETGPVSMVSTVRDLPYCCTVKAAAPHLLSPTSLLKPPNRP